MTNESKTRDCPYCKEEIRVDAIKCKHCGSSVAPEKPAHEGTCPYCKEQIHPEAIICKHCKSDVRSIGYDEGSCGGETPSMISRPYFDRPMAVAGAGIKIGCLEIGRSGDCTYVKNVCTRRYCLYCKTLTSCWDY